MVPTEHAVERLRGHLTEILDDVDADTLVSVFDTSQLATKNDLAVLEQKLIAAFRAEINTAITSQTRPLLIAIVSTAVIFAGSLLAAIRIA